MGRFFLVFLITLSLEILEITLFPYPLLFIWVICFSVVSLERESFCLSFLSGLFSDFLEGQDFGKSSLFFLGISLLIAFYKRKFKVLHPLYFFPFMIFSLLIFNYFEFGEVLFLKIPYSLLIGVCLFKLAQVLKITKEIKVEV